MNQVAEHTVKVAGGSIYYATRGSGPVLLIMGGGPSNADTLEPLASLLAEDSTVVTYDRRGYSRSQADDPAEPAGIPLHADDASRLIAEVGSGPVSVFGTSFGALIALELAAAAPADIAASVGVSRGNTAGEGAAGLAAGPAPTDVELFIRRDAPAIGDYRLDLDRLPPMAGRLIVTASEGSRDFYPYQCTLRLARQLGMPLVELPGNHAGMIQHPAQFAARLRSLLRQPAAPVAGNVSDSAGGTT